MAGVHSNFIPGSQKSSNEIYLLRIFWVKLKHCSASSTLFKMSVTMKITVTTANKSEWWYSSSMYGSGMGGAAGGGGGGRNENTL